MGFPKAPSSVREPKDNEKKEEILKKVSEILGSVYDIIENCDENTTETVLKKEHISEDDFIASLKVSHCGRSAVFKINPKDMFRNGCHH